MPRTAAEWWSEFTYRARSLLFRARVEQELHDELAFHLARETERLRGSGLSAMEAERQARLAFGGVERIKDDTRDAHGITVVEHAVQDARYALRGLRRSPGFTATVLLTLALGIGANAAVFEVVDRMLFRPPALLRDPSTVHRVYLVSTFQGERDADATFEYRRYHDFARLTTSVSQAAAFAVRGAIVGTGEASRELQIGVASATFFSFFDAAPVIGRFYNASEDTLPAGADVAVLSYPFWLAWYGGAHDVLGERVQVGARSYEIVGVAPPSFAGVAVGATPALWIPLTARASLNPGFNDSYDWGWLNMIVRRKAGATVAAATADLTHAYEQSWLQEAAISNVTPIATAKPAVILGPVESNRGPNRGPEATVVLWVAGVALITLLVACANVANLLLARAFRRRREIALRLALGVGRGRLVAQLITESLLLAAFGGIAGVLVGWAGARALTHVVSDKSTDPLAIADGRTIAFCALAALVVGIVTGLAPAVFSGKELFGALRAGSRGGAYQRSKLRAALVITQAALSVVLLVGAGLFVRSLIHVTAVPLGYDATPVVMAQINWRGASVPPASQLALERHLAERARAMPGVVDASLALSVPFYAFESVGLYVSGIDSVRKLGRFQLEMASPEYFHTMNTHIIAGRGFTAADGALSAPVVVVSQEMARRLWPGQPALGKCIRMRADTAPCRTVIGIAQDILQHQLSHTVDPTYYVPVDQGWRTDFGLLVRMSSNARIGEDAVRSALQKEMPGAAVITIMPMADLLDSAERAWSVGAQMFAGLGAIALLLAGLGLYSVIAYGVAQRTQEMGVRIALGARGSSIPRLIAAEGLRLAGLGVVIGVGVALLAAKPLTPLLFDESPRDPTVYGAVAFTLLAVALAASVIPALRAMRVDPNIALRSD